MTVYYKVVDVWCKYPFQQEIDYRYCIFSTSKRKFNNNLLDITMDSQTTINQKIEFLSERLGNKVKQVIKLK